MFTRIKSNKILTAGLIIIGTLLILMLLSLFWTPNDPYYIPYESDINYKMLLPSVQFPLGTDHLGRCILSRVMKASQMAFLVGTMTLVVSGIIGITIGMVSGFFGGIVDELLMRFTDIIITIPGTLLLLIFIAVFGVGTMQTVIAISIMNFTTFAKMIRSRVISIKESDYVLWGKSIGAPQYRILLHHILPELLPIVLVISAMKFSGAVMAEAGLSYLGLGVQAPHPSWGNMLARAQTSITTNIYYALIPGLLITALVIGFNLISDGLKKELGIGQ